MQTSEVLETSEVYEEITMPKPITHNTLFYGDNLSISRKYFPDDMPSQTFKQTERGRKQQGRQGELGI